MAQPIDPIAADLRLAQLLGEDSSAPAPGATAANPAPAAPTGANFSGNIFEDVLARAVDSLNGVSQAENYASQLTDQYLKGQADLQEVMVAQSKMGLMVQMAVTSVNSVVNTFKEITQMQV